MNKIKKLCKKHNISHRQLGVLMGYSRDHIQRINTGKRKLTPHFEYSLKMIEKLLGDGTIKIPK